MLCAAACLWSCHSLLCTYVANNLKVHVNLDVYLDTNDLPGGICAERRLVRTPKATCNILYVVISPTKTRFEPCLPKPHGDARPTLHGDVTAELVCVNECPKSCTQRVSRHRSIIVYTHEGLRWQGDGHRNNRKPADFPRNTWHCTYEYVGAKAYMRET